MKWWTNCGGSLSWEMKDQKSNQKTSLQSLKRFL